MSRFNNLHRSEADEYGISSFVYRARKPFHPLRLMDFINEAFTTVDSYEKETDVSSDDLTEDDDEPLQFDVGASKILRSKGFFWLASHYQKNCIWSQAGGLMEFSSGGNWWIDTSIDMWPTDEEDISQIKFDYFDKTGDRRQEVVFIGLDLDQDKIIKALDSCLLTDEELKLDLNHWDQYEDVFAISE